MGKILTGEQTKVGVCFKETSRCFSKKDDDLGFNDTVQQKIVTIGEVPVKLPHGRIAPNQIDEVKLHTKKLEAGAPMELLW